MKLLRNKNMTFLLILILVSFNYAQVILNGNKIFKVNWGNTPETVKLGKFFEFETWGVRDFWVDNDDCFYILDTMNKEVKKFNGKGSLQWHIPLPCHPLYIWKFNDSNFVVLCTTWKRYKLFIINNNGVIIKNSVGIKLPYSKNGKFLSARSIGGIAILRVYKNNIYLQSQKDAVILDENLNIVGSIFIPDTVKLAFFMDNGLIYPIKYRNFQANPYIEIFSPKNFIENEYIELRLDKLSDGIEIRSEMNSLQRLLGFDTEGNFYIQRSFWEQRKSPLKLVLKFDRRGQEISRKFIHSEVIHSVSYPIKVMPNGDIYTQNSNKEKYWIEKYPAGLFDN